MTLWARSANSLGQKQTLKEHLETVAATARAFGEPLGIGEEAYWAGLLHDVGKATPEFQRRLDGAREAAPHAAYGACIAAAAGAYEAALAINAHHAGLHQGSDLQKLPRERPLGRASGQTFGDRSHELLAAVLADVPALSVPPTRSRRAVATADPAQSLELRARLVLSCLVDADRLDAEHHTTPERSEARTRPVPAMAELAARVERHIDAIAATKPDGVVKDVRAEVRAASLAAASQPPGLYTLTVPTGGGKTLASLLYALKHAALHGLRRVIVVVPFLAIIEQNAKAIRAALGELEGSDEQPIVLEHHSNVIEEKPQPDDDDCRREGENLWPRLAAENWDAPVIITTSVQYLESLFTRSAGRARKLHRIAHSVVVFDEVQTFPPELLVPTLGMLRQWQAEYGTSMLFCTATQPAFEERSSQSTGAINSGGLRRWPANALREVMPAPASLFDRLRRVTVEWPVAGKRLSWDELAQRLATERQALVIVNTKRQARELYKAVGDRVGNDADVVHLSARMYPAHRSAILKRVSEALEQKRRCLVVATQLVEAGVDLDFPVVYRAFGPLVSIAQAAGRCNREGALRDASGVPKRGRVVVFLPEFDQLPKGIYRLATSITGAMLENAGAKGLDIDDPRSFTEFFERLYRTSDLDKQSIGGWRAQLNFDEVHTRYHIIDDDTVSVVMPCDQTEKLLLPLRRGAPPTRALLRSLQPYTVGLYRQEFEAAQRAGALEAFLEDTLQVALPGNYDRKLGFVFTGDAVDLVL